MKVILLVALFCLIAVSAKGENGKYSLEKEVFGADSPIKFLMEGLIEDGSNTELSSYIKVFNQVFPLVKALSSAADAASGQAVKEFRYNYCLRDNEGNEWLCFNAIWNFIVGWHADQFHDEKRFYNLTITPYASMTSDLTLSFFSGPAKIDVGPYFDFVNFTAPLSFEMEDRDTLCYDGNMNIHPITIETAVVAKFLECEVVIPEDTHTCDWDSGVGARIYQAQLNEGYHSVLLDRTCIKAQ